MSESLKSPVFVVFGKCCFDSERQITEFFVENCPQFIAFFVYPVHGGATRGQLKRYFIIDVILIFNCFEPWTINEIKKKSKTV